MHTDMGLILVWQGIFSPKSTFSADPLMMSARSLMVSAQPMNVIAYINIYTHIKDPGHPHGVMLHHTTGHWHWHWHWHWHQHMTCDWLLSCVKVLLESRKSFEGLTANSRPCRMSTFRLILAAWFSILPAFSSFTYTSVDHRMRSCTISERKPTEEVLSVLAGFIQEFGNCALMVISVNT